MNGDADRAPASRPADGTRSGRGEAHRIYRVRVNGEALAGVPEARLRETLATFKGGAALYRASCGLGDGETLETDIVVHGKPLHVRVRVDVWVVLAEAFESVPSRGRGG